MSFEDRKIALINIIPESLRADTMMRLYMFPDPPADSPQHVQDEYFNRLRSTIMKNIELTVQLSRSSKPLNNVDDAEPVPEQSYGGEDYNWDDEAPASDDPSFPFFQVARQAYAVYQGARKGGGKKGKGKGKGAKGKGKGFGRCVNCGKPDHIAANRPNPVVPANQRPCFNCGERGHQASKCPKPKATVNSVKSEEKEPVVWTLVPETAPVKLHNKFEALEVTEAPDVSTPRVPEGRCVVPKALRCADCQTPAPEKRTVRRKVRFCRLDSCQSNDGCTHIFHDEEFPPLAPAEGVSEPQVARTRSGDRVSASGPLAPTAKHQALDYSVLLLDIETEEINNVQDDVPFSVVLDSGAAEHVTDNVDALGYAIEPSPGSRAGKGFIAANGAKIANKGQMTLSLRADDGRPIVSTFQVCETNRPLWSVGKICDSGCKVVFDSNKAEVIRKTTGKPVCTFQRSGGLYVANLTLSNPKRSSSFTRQGRP